MSQDGEELDLQALERQLDDAFQTTRPRPDFEDELWLRVQSSRPAQSRFRDAMAAFWNGVREVPAVPATATALVLIVAVGAGIVALNGLGHGGGGASSSAVERAAAPAAGQYLAGNFGKLPSPVFSNAPKATAPAANAAAPQGTDYAGPVQLTWTGTLDVHLTTAPVFRYREPSSTDADQFASALGAAPRGRPSGFLGMYAAADYTLKIRGTVTSPPSSPAYFIFSGLNLPPIDAAGGPQNLADVFLAQHSLQPQWQYTVGVDSSGDPVKVVYQRQFDVPGYGPAYSIDFNANRYGLEVDLSGNRPVLASGVLPVSLDIANYNVISSADAIRSATGFGASSSDAAAPVAKLDHAELVYVLVPAGDHSFYEPAFLFTGAVQVGGQSYTKHVLVSAVDPVQRNP
ncbi:MAG TPA: hypothetical protein VGX22_14585 [Candidatus Dormibacteraeota bacterium]|nr:hypothetical protein [Candidatus Dormibacteraeota bacterium]